jgi:S-sulfo-L-cysteine synthase (O-acetyl-L-serine-dependent)
MRKLAPSGAPPVGVPPTRVPSPALPRVGGTSLRRLRSLEPSSGVEVYAKAEWENPGGSIKDRPALFMIRGGLRSGALTPGRRILDASSGNTAIAYAWIGAALGYPVTVVLPANVTPTRLRLLESWGAETVLTDPQEGMDGAITRARLIHAADPGGYYYPDQYTNPGNWRAHYVGTGEEILAQTGGRITHFVAGLGTTGTFTGVGRRLREADPGVRLVAVQPDSPLHALEGLKHLATAQHPPAIYDPGLADGTETVSTEEAREAAGRLLADEGLRVGPSSAANAVAAGRVAASAGAGTVVTVFPDAAAKYLDQPFWRGLDGA